MKNTIGKYEKNDLLSSVTLKKRSKKGADTGANVILSVDGTIIKSATSFEYKVNAKGIARMTIKLIGRLIKAE